jgi:CheY-like chemotaxis protein
VDVADTGPGVPTERQARLFEPFEQGDSAITHTYGGSGLGLALSRKLAERLGGSLVLLRSVPGGGSTFRLVVKPISQAPPPQLEAPRTLAPTSPSGLTGVRILLAEDHPDMQLAIRLALESEGATVVGARDGIEAVDTLRSGGFDVVLMDLRMPKLDGLQATRSLRREGCAVPVIAISADPESMGRPDAVAAGCDDFLSKPFAVGDLVGVIRSRLEAQIAPS